MYLIPPDWKIVKTQDGKSGFGKTAPCFLISLNNEIHQLSAEDRKQNPELPLGAHSDAKSKFYSHETPPPSAHSGYPLFRIEEGTNIFFHPYFVKADLIKAEFKKFFSSKELREAQLSSIKLFGYIGEIEAMLFDDYFDEFRYHPPYLAEQERFVDDLKTIFPVLYIYASELREATSLEKIKISMFYAFKNFVEGIVILSPSKILQQESAQKHPRMLKHFLVEKLRAIPELHALLLTIESKNDIYPVSLFLMKLFMLSSLTVERKTVWRNLINIYYEPTMMIQDGGQCEWGTEKFIRFFSDTLRRYGYSHHPTQDGERIIKIRDPALNDIYEGLKEGGKYSLPFRPWGACVLNIPVM